MYGDKRYDEILSGISTRNGNGNGMREARAKSTNVQEDSKKQIVDLGGLGMFRLFEILPGVLFVFFDLADPSLRSSLDQQQISDGGI